MKIGFIGPGKVGVNLGRYFTHKGIIVSGYLGKNIKSTQDACKITNSKMYNNLEELINDCDIIFITTPDDDISILDNQISKYNLKNKSVCHASGSLKSTILSNAKFSGAKIYSVHPMFAFSNKNIDLTKLERIYFSIEGELYDDLNSDSSIIKLMKTIGNKYFTREIKYSSTYHLANVFVSNLVLSLLEIGTSYLKLLGLNEKESIEALYPLIQGNIESIHDNGFQQSLSGPVLRGDIETIKKHISVIKNEDNEIYNNLSLNLLKVVALRKINEDKSIENQKNTNKEDAINFLINKNDKYNEIFNLLGGLHS